jgi:hypothetical protein
LAVRAKESRAAALFNAPHRLTARAALLSLAIIYSQYIFKSLKPPLRIAKIRCGIAAAFYRTMENVNNGLVQPPCFMVIETSQDVLA